MRKHILLSFVGLVSLVWSLLACSPAAAPSGPGPAPSQSVSNPVDAVELKQPVELTFMHRQTGNSEALQQKLIDEFMAANPNIKIKAESLGDYDKLYQKVISTIQAGSPPEFVAAYENVAAEYYDAGALVPFDDYITSKKYGLSDADMADYVPAYIEATKFAQYGGKKLTFPYTKSDLLMYTNMEVLRSLGFEKPAATWDEFLNHCRKAVAGGRQCFAHTVDPSFLDGVVFTFGGEVLTNDGKRVLFDEPAGNKALQLFETMAKEKLIYQTQGSGDEESDLVSGKALYMMRSVTSVPRLADRFKDINKWEVTIIPQGTAGSKPVTVLFGANISIMKSTPEKQLAAWMFIKYFTSKEVTARWGLDPSNGYFPVRTSALDTPLAKKYMEDNPRFRQAIEISRFAKVEPSVRGWQEVRNTMTNTVTGIITGKMTASEAGKDLVQKGNKALADAQR